MKVTAYTFYWLQIAQRNVTFLGSWVILRFDFTKTYICKCLSTPIAKNVLQILKKSHFQHF